MGEHGCWGTATADDRKGADAMMLLAATQSWLITALSSKDPDKALLDQGVEVIETPNTESRKAA